MLRILSCSSDYHVVVIITFELIIMFDNMAKCRTMIVLECSDTLMCDIKSVYVIIALDMI